ncbi:hypothetical protein PG988_003653 [Apiospora saccharicola]
MTAQQQQDGPSHAHPPRASFDERYDGPYGRPSLTSGRYLSLSQACHVHTWEETRCECLLKASRSDDVDVDIDIRPPGIAHLQEAKSSDLGDASSSSLSSRRPAPPPPTPSQAEAALEPVPPPLNYTLRGRRSGIALFVFYTFLDSLVLPVGLYFLLWYGFGPGNRKYHPLSASTVLTIVTSAMGAPASTRCSSEPGGFVRRTAIAGAFLPDEPDKRLLALPLSTVLFLFGTVSLGIDLLHWLAVPAPVRISSIPRGAQLRPGIYPLIEDICAVDGSGGTEFRRDLNRRYAASHVFRTMLRRLGLFWAVGADCCALTTAGLVFGLAAAVDDDLIDYAYTVGWVLPFLWAGPWAWATVVYVRRELRKEKRLWAMEVEMRNIGV